MKRIVLVVLAVTAVSSGAFAQMADNDTALSALLVSAPTRASSNGSRTTLMKW
jgi:hypothetical protein